MTPTSLTCATFDPLTSCPPGRIVECMKRILMSALGLVALGAAYVSEPAADTRPEAFECAFTISAVDDGPNLVVSWTVETNWPNARVFVPGFDDWGTEADEHGNSHGYTVLEDVTSAARAAVLQTSYGADMRLIPGTPREFCEPMVPYKSISMMQR